MNIIYGGAYATIVALEGDSPAFGLPRASGRERVEARSAATQGSFHVGDTQFLSAMPTLSQRIEQSRWVTRAWTYQEAVLSPRNLFFTRDQVYFACNLMQCCEAIDETASSLHTKSEDSRVKSLSGCDCHEGPHKALGEGIFRNPGTEQLRHDQKSKWRLLRYETALTNYSSRSMTHKEDALAAFRGIVNEFDKTMFDRPAQDDTLTRVPDGGGFIWGLPLRVLPQALLFNHEAPVNRREGFPSWSWVGWEGKIRRAFRGAEGNIVFDQPKFRAWSNDSGNFKLLFERYPGWEPPEVIPLQEVMLAMDDKSLAVEGCIWSLGLRFNGAPKPEPGHEWDSLTFQAFIEGFGDSTFHCDSQATVRLLRSARQPLSLLLLQVYLESYNGSKVYHGVLLDWVDAVDADSGNTRTYFEAMKWKRARRVGTVTIGTKDQPGYWSQNPDFQPFWAYLPCILI
jgi:Heterokaryon incompatibility protein (HET)